MSRNKYPEKTEQLIISVAAKLFFEKGYEKTSLNDIISNLGGLTKGAIYSHFKSKEEIYQAVIYQLTSSSDDAITEIIKNKQLTGREKIKIVLNESLEAAVKSREVTGKIDYSKNPVLLYNLLNELKNEIAPLFILPLIKQGVKDGSIVTDFPNELAEMLSLFVNLWLNPLVFECTSKEITNKCRLFSSMLEPFNLNVLDDQTVKKLKKLATAKKSES